MQTIPEHLVPLLHYRPDGSIYGDTDEAQQFAEKMGWDNANFSIQDILEAVSISFFSAVPARDFFWENDLNYLLGVVHTHLKNFQQLYKNNNFNEQLLSALIELSLNECLKKSIFSTQQITLQALINIYKIYLDENLIEFPKAFLKELGASKKFVKNIKTSKIISLHIKNYFCIEDIELENLNSREIYFLGRNGDGKTVLLQSIVIALKYAYLQHIAPKNNIGIILGYLQENPNFWAEAKSENSEILNNQAVAIVRNVYAYGVQRHQYTTDLSTPQSDYDTEGFLTLFEGDKKLYSPDKWLLDTEFRELKAEKRGHRPRFRIDDIIFLLENLLNDQLNDKNSEPQRAVKIKIEDTTVQYYEGENSQPLSFSQLSAGYQSILIWAADFVARASEQQPHIQKLEDLEGIVLIDEVGLLLHPKWEYHIMRKLRRQFPKVQFIVTTHSPVLLMGASEDAIIYRIGKDADSGKTTIIGSIAQEEIRQMMVNQIITSPLFGLETMAARGFKNENASDDDFIYEKIHEAIRLRLKNTPTLDNEEILRQIQAELDNLSPLA